jgi:hypothetical protein
MKLAIIFTVLGVYFVLAIAIARFCAVNAGWEKAADLAPPEDDTELARPERKVVGKKEGRQPGNRRQEPEEGPEG